VAVAAPKVESGFEIDMVNKRLLYKMITNNKDGASKVTIDQLWRLFMAAPDSETQKRGKSLVQSKAHLIQIIEALETDNLVMYSNEDGNVVLI
jgi:hypothetical protein